MDLARTTARAAALMLEVRAGSRDALGALYEMYYLSLWRLGRIITRSPEVAGEAVQDVFVRLWERRDTIDIRGDIGVYLHTAVRHHARNLIKHEKVVAAYERAVEEARMAPPAMSRHPQAQDTDLEMSEFYAAYQRTLSLLTERDRIALRLRWEEEMTFQQIGQVLGLSTVGARAVVLRAHQRIQEQLLEYRPSA